MGHAPRLLQGKFLEGGHREGLAGGSRWMVELLAVTPSSALQLRHLATVREHPLIQPELISRTAIFSVR